MKLTAALIGGAQIANAINNLRERIPGQITQAARETAETIQSRVDAPGHLAESWELRSRPGGASLVNTAPDAHRYEYGFHGVDALGRHVDQPPRPFLLPAVTGMSDDFMERLKRLF